jgi:acyl-CoA synthetase (AMP-forming)/AMP-acid ligase II
MPEFPLTNAYWHAQTCTPLRESTIGSTLRDAAALAPGKVALIDGDPGLGQRRQWTYGELLADAERAAQALLRRFSPGERMAIWSGNSPEWVILEFAAALAGLTLVTVNPAYRGEDLAHVLGHSEADGLFMADEHQGCDLHAILDKVRGRPMPLFHVGGGLFTFGAVSAAAAHVLMPRFSPALQLELIEAYRATVLLGVPTMMLAMLGHPDLAKRDLTSLRRALSGGALSPPALVRQAEATLGLTYSISFAQTESSCSITMSGSADSVDDRAETLGRPLPQTEVRIADLGTGDTAGCDAVGEICTRGYLVMRGYLNAPEATAAAIDADGWLHTGDLGSMDERGYLRIAGRIKDMIIRGGENIYPREIEEVLTSHPAVADASVLGFPDDHYGETVAAAIRVTGPDPAGDELAADDLAAQLAEFCRARLAAYKVPIRWLITDAFPLTASGKVRKDALRDQLAARPPL